MSDKTILFCARFLNAVDTKLRETIHRRGELVELIILMLKTVDLTTIPLLEINSELDELYATTVKLPDAVHKKLKKTAAQRNSSMNALLNSAIWAYDPRSHEKSATSRK